MSLLALGIAALTWTLSVFFLEPFYQAQKRHQLKEIASRIGPVGNSVAGLYNTFASLERSTTVHITVVNVDGRVAYDSNSPNLPHRDERTPPMPSPVDPERPPPFVPSGIRPGEPGERPGSLPLLWERFEDGTSVFETHDPRLGVRLLYLTQRQESGSLLALSFPLAQIRESARIATLFLSVSCLLAILVGALMSLLLARSVTRPFMKLMAFSKSLAELDFTHRFESRRDDEVAALGRTMNDLSESLERALAELKKKNEKLREDVRREQGIDRMRREFISSVSHELKTPIALILGYAEACLKMFPEVARIEIHTWR